MIDHVPDNQVWRRLKGERDTSYLTRLMLELRVVHISNDTPALGPAAAALVRQAIARAARAADPEYVA